MNKKKPEDSQEHEESGDSAMQKIVPIQQLKQIFSN